jgi:hypothetical protein
MTRGAGPRLLGRGGIGVLWTLLVWALISVPRPTSAQQEQLLFQRQAEYTAAQDRYRASVSAWNAQEGRWIAASEARIAAVNSGNSSRLEAASQVAMDESMELTRQSGVVELAEKALDAARKALQDALELRQDALAAQVENASPAQRPVLLGQIRGISEELEALEPETPTGPELRFLPALDLNPRDGKFEIESKIGLLERRIQDARAEVTRVNEELTRLRRQQDMRRMAGDARSNRDFFDNGPPGARAGRLPADPTQAAATTTAAASSKTIEQKIEEFTAYKATLDLLQEQLRARVSSFKSKLGVIGGNL